MIRKLKRIEPLQLGKMLGATYGLLSLLFVPFFLLFVILTVLAPGSDGDPPKIAIVLTNVAFAILLPLTYAVMGFVFGLIGAWVYNLVARWIGGLEFEIE